MGAVLKRCVEWQQKLIVECVNMDMNDLLMIKFSQGLPTHSFICGSLL